MNEAPEMSLHNAEHGKAYWLGEPGVPPVAPAVAMRSLRPPVSRRAETGRLDWWEDG